MSNPESNRPIEEFSAGAIKIPVWANEHTGDNGTYTALSAQIQKRYFDRKTRQWRESKSFTANDLADLQLALEDARRFMKQRNHEARQGI